MHSMNSLACVSPMGGFRAAPRHPDPAGGWPWNRCSAASTRKACWSDHKGPEGLFVTRFASVPRLCLQPQRQTARAPLQTQPPLGSLLLHSHPAGRCAVHDKLYPHAAPGGPAGGPPFPAAPRACCCDDVWVQVVRLHGVDAAHVVCRAQRQDAAVTVSTDDAWAPSCRGALAGVRCVGRSKGVVGSLMPANTVLLHAAVLGLAGTLHVQ